MAGADAMGCGVGGEGGVGGVMCSVGVTGCSVVSTVLVKGASSATGCGLCSATVCEGGGSAMRVCSIGGASVSGESDDCAASCFGVGAGLATGCTAGMESVGCLADCAGAVVA